MLRLAAKAGTRKVAILRYHSVLPEPEIFGGSIGSGITHSAESFAQQIQFIASKCRPVTLDQVCAFLQGREELPCGAVAITFDDGFADNLEVAAPILAHYGVPAAFYLAVDYIENRMQPWYVRLRNAFTVSKVSRWEVEGGTGFEMSDEEQRRQAFLDSTRKCAKLCRVSQEKLLSEIETKLEVEPFAVPVMLTWSGARELISQGHIVGSHTLSHPNLAYIKSDELRDEIVSSKTEIEKQVGSPVTHFSYPSPILEPHYSDDSMEIIRSAGYLSAVTCRRGTVMRGDNNLTLKRVFAPQTLSAFEWALENSLMGRVV